MQRALIAAFEKSPGAVLSVEQLVAIAFPGTKPEPKHRIAVGRAARRLAEERNDFESFVGKAGTGGRILSDATDARSLGIGRVFAHFRGAKTIRECEAFLDNPDTEAFREARPHGFFPLLAARNGHLAAGRDEEAEILTVEIRRRVAEAERTRLAAKAPEDVRHG